MSPTKLLKTVLAGAVMLAPASRAKYELPKGVVLPEGVVLPDDFELPEGIVIPEGFVITQDMVDQYIRYMESQKGGGSAAVDDNAWFKELATSHPNANLQMNVQKMDTAAANEEALFKEKLEESLMSKEVILPILLVAVVIIAIWGFMTKCGKRPCCKKSSGMAAHGETRKSVKSERASPKDDNESGSAGSGNMNTDMSLAGTANAGTTFKHGVSKIPKVVQLDMDLSSSAMPFERASEPNKPSQSMTVSQAPQAPLRNSN